MDFHNADRYVSPQVAKDVELIFNNSLLTVIAETENRLTMLNIKQICEAINKLYNEVSITTKMTQRQQKRLRFHGSILNNRKYKNKLVGHEYKNLSFVERPFEIQLDPDEDNKLISSGEHAVLWTIKNKAKGRKLPRSNKLFLMCMFAGMNKDALDIIYETYITYLTSLNEEIK